MRSSSDKELIGGKREGRIKGIIQTDLYVTQFIGYWILQA